MSDLIKKQDAIDAIYKTFSYAYCDNCEKELYEDSCEDCHRKYQNWSASKKTIEQVINNLSSANASLMQDRCKIDASSDLISRQETIDAIENKTYRHSYLEQVIDIVKEVPSAQQWIPCSERLPEEEQDVLITDGTLIWVCTLIKADCGYMWDDDYGYWHPINEWKAWMPLPEPYKEEGDKDV